MLKCLKMQTNHDNIRVEVLESQYIHAYVHERETPYVWQTRTTYNCTINISKQLYEGLFTVLNHYKVC